MKTRERKREPKTGVVEACRRCHLAFRIKDSIFERVMRMSDRRRMRYAK